MKQANDKSLRSEGASVISAFLFALMAIMVKLSAGHLSGIQISFFRFLIGGILSAAALVLFRQKFFPDGWIPVMMRALLGSISMIIFYQAIDWSSGGRATLLNNLYPFFVALFGGLFFKEKLKPLQMVFMVVSFAGTVVIFYDGSHYSLLSNLMSVSSALIVGLSVNFMKKAREKNNANMIYLWICIFGTIFSAPSMVSSLPMLKVLPVRDWFFVIGTAIVVLGAQFFFTWGQKYLSVVRNSFIQFLKIPITLLLSILFLQEEMTQRFWIGCVLVVAGLALDSMFLAIQHGSDDDSEESEVDWEKPEIPQA